MVINNFVLNSCCVDMDECSAKETPCGKNSRCTNSAGSFFCSCLRGYVGDGKTCKGMESRVTINLSCVYKCMRYMP